MSLYYKPRKTWRLPRISRGLVFSVAVLTLVVGAAVDALNQRTPIGDSPTPIVTAPQVAEPIVVSEYMRYYNIGHTAYKQGEYLTAWLNFGSALEAKQGEWTNGDNVTVQTVYYLRGKSAEKLNLLESALKDYDIAANYYGDAASRQMYENLEARLLTMKNAMGTVDFNADATDANMLAYESSIAIDRHDYALANEMLNQAIDLEPNNTYFLNMRAYNAHLLDSHDHAAALADYNRVIELDPTDAYAYMGRGHALSSLGQYQEAWRSFEKAVQLEPDYYGTYLSWGLAYQRMGDDLNAGDMLWRWFTRPEATFNEAAFMNERATLILHEDHVYLMSIPVRAGQVLNVVAGSDNPFTVDPTLVLLDPSGTPVAGNDDRISDEDFTAALTNIQITEDGIYTLAVSHAGGGAEGEVRVEYQLENGFVSTPLTR